MDLRVFDSLMTRGTKKTHVIVRKCQIFRRIKKNTWRGSERNENTCKKTFEFRIQSHEMPTCVLVDDHTSNFYFIFLFGSFRNHDCACFCYIYRIWKKNIRSSQYSRNLLLNGVHVFYIFCLFIPLILLNFHQPNQTKYLPPRNGKKKTEDFHYKFCIRMGISK